MEGSSNYVPDGGGFALCWAGKRGESVFERVPVSALKGRERVTVEEYEARKAEARSGSAPAPVADRPTPKRNQRKAPASPPSVVIGG